MSKLIKIGLVFLLIGLGIVIAIPLTSNTQVFGMGDENYTLYEQTFKYDDFTDIYFDFDNREVYILESTDNDVHLKYYIHDKDEYSQSMDNNQLSLSISRKWYYNLFSLDIFTNREKYQVHLYIPNISIIESLKIHTSNGKMEMNIDHQFNSISLASSNGDIKVLNIETNTLTLNTSNGDISIKNLLASQEIKIDTSNGKILMDNILSPEITGDTSNGKIEAVNIVSSDISLDTSNGKIYLTVKGIIDDYRVSLSTSNGDKVYNGLKVESGTINSDGGKYISLDSSNGDVEVKFID